MTTPSTTELIRKRRHFCARWALFTIGTVLRFTLGIFGTSIVIVMTQVIVAISFISLAVLMEIDHNSSSPTLAKGPILTLVFAYMLKYPFTILVSAYMLLSTHEGS